MSRMLFLLLVIFYKYSSAETEVNKLDFNYPCDNIIRIAFDVSKDVSEQNFTKEITFLASKVFEKWNYFDRLSITRFANTGRFTPVKNKLDLIQYVQSSKRIETERSNICSIMNNFDYTLNVKTNVIIFTSVFSKDIVWNEITCDEEITACNKCHFTIVPLSDKVVFTDVYRYFHDSATIIQWDMDKADEPLDWERLFWEKGYGCDPSDFPASTPLPTRLANTQRITTTQKTTTAKTPIKQASTKINVNGEQTKQSFSSTHSTKKPKTTNLLVILLSVFVPLAFIVILCLIVFVVWYYRKKQTERQVFFRNVPGRRSRMINDQDSTDLWKIRARNLIVNYEDKLGSGSFGQVFVGQLVGDSGIARVYRDSPYLQQFSNCKVAVKTLNSSAGDEEKEEFGKEINFMKSLKYHPHLVCMLGYTSNAENLLLVLEYCGNGDLLHFVRANKEHFIQRVKVRDDSKLKTFISFAWQIADGLKYLASLNLIHRDVSARNILLDNGNTCKIADFGLCRETNNQIYLSKISKLPLRWMSLESIRSFVFSEKSDVWSYGVLLYEIFSLGDTPYADVDNTQIFTFLELGKRLEQPMYCSNEIYRLMLECWDAEVERRPNFVAICQFFSKILANATLFYNYVDAIKAYSEIKTETVDGV